MTDVAPQAETEPLDPFRYIDVEKTIAEFGYDPRELNKFSKKKTLFICQQCNCVVAKRFVDGIKGKYCSDCRFFRIVELNKNRPLTPEHKEKMQAGRRANPIGYKWTEESKKKVSKSLKKTFSERPELKENISKRNKKRIFSKETLEKMSINRKGKRTGKEHPRYGVSAAHGKGAWYVRKDGSKVWMRSGWEIKFAEYLDRLNKEWQYEPKRFAITYFSDLHKKVKEGTYGPDFFVDNSWYEIKGNWRDDAKPKFEAFKEQYPNERITLLMKPELLALGIEL